jgi:hypothetical protein
MLDSPEGVCAGQAGSEYPATSVPFSKCSLHAPRSRSHQRHHSTFRASHLAQHRPLPAHLPTTNATPAPQQHSRTNPTPHPSPSVVPLPSTRTIQLQHTTAMHRRCLCWQVLWEQRAASWASERHRHLGPSANRAAPRRLGYGLAMANLSPLRFSRCAEGEESGYRPQLFLCCKLPRMGRTRGVLDQPRSVVLWRISGTQRRWGSPGSHWCWWARQGLNL